MSDQADVRKQAKRSRNGKLSGIPREASLDALVQGTKSDPEDAKKLLENRAWPARHATDAERGAYKLGQLAALETALGGDQGLAAVPNGMLTSRDVLMILENFLLKGQITPHAAQAIIEELIIGPARDSVVVK